MRKKAAMFAAATVALTCSFTSMVSAQDSTSALPPAQPQGQIIQPQNGSVDWKGVGVGAGTLGANVLYIPAKLVYGILGGIGGGAGYLLTGGNTQVSNTIWRSSLGGDYVVTPDMVRGDQPVHFSGPTQTASSQETALPAVTTSPDNGSGAANGASNSPVAVQPMTSSSMTRSNGGMGSFGQPASTATHPLDSGTGPVGGGSSHNPPPPLPDTGIE